MGIHGFNIRSRIDVATAVLFGMVGALCGLIFPIIFLFLDIRQMGDEFTLANIQFTISSQYIYTFSIIAFPLIFSTISLMFYKIRRDAKRIKEEQQKSFANSKLASIGVLAAGVGHEINNPLSILMGNQDMLRYRLKEQGLDLSTVSENFQVFDKTIERMATIVDGLRMMSRTGQEVEMFPLNASQFVGQFVRTIKQIYLKEGIEIQFETEDKHIYFQGYEGKFQQVLLNLFTNAKQAIELKGEPGKINVSLTKSKNFIIISVSDNGVGISKKDQAHIFEAFYTTKEVGQGTGLGLSIVREIIEEMQGEISFKSKEGQGSSFELKFPLVKISNSHLYTNESESEDEVFNEMTGEVLIVDDEESIREYLNFVFSEKKLTVHEAENGEEGLQKIKTNKYDVVVTDLKMPKLNGLEMLAHAKSFPHFSSISFVVITGGIENEYDSNELAKFAELPNVEIIRKPFKTVDLLQTVQNMALGLDRHKKAS